jgi:hypothetical protein
MLSTAMSGDSTVRYTARAVISLYSLRDMIPALLTRDTLQCGGELVHAIPLLASNLWKDEPPTTPTLPFCIPPQRYTFKVKRSDD